ncbi:tautomerase [Poseidonibacter ostreae]|jgi:5-carboxymethyl-2-hydroxymuconate isomerase|uniref:Tautomerase n=1 Tax=Poseidonibacter ostreae TaxID=2654171 RepID=A0A6L4WP96_9BACT|nr:tautomerase [Poseidonibacter ostreae]KAB7884558.1 tautomerase [Poseidonibacter ostreae]KAB7885706.1 tautomerase [Poseidonibacter ostreae]KAB7890372.1 tautomerase [Poseidonibacter ostreae]
MPHLQFEINKKIENNIKEEFITKVMSIFSKVMDTGTDHIAISIREYDKYSLSIGRADIKDDICLMNLDIREGRTLEKRRELVLLYMDLVENLFNVNRKNQYATLTEHKGEDFHLIEKYLGSWERGEDPLA